MEENQNNIKKRLCPICNIPTKNLGMHLKKHGYTTEQYYLTFIGTKTQCEFCGKDTKFMSIDYGYQTYCSLKCSNSSNTTKEKIKETWLQKYGVDNPSKIEEIKEKKRKTCEKNFGVSYGVQSDIVKDKMKKTFMDHFGVDNPLKSKEIREKIKQTTLAKYGKEFISQTPEFHAKLKDVCVQRYGVVHPSVLPEVREKYKKTCLLKYGVDNVSKDKTVNIKRTQTFLNKYGTTTPFQNNEIKEKIYKTNLIKYGCKIPTQNEKIKIKMIETVIKHYGVSHPLKCSEVKEKIKKTCLLRYGVDSPTKSNIMKEKSRLKFYKNLLNSDRLKDRCVPLFEKEDYIDVTHNYSWKCTICNTNFEDILDNGHIPRCPLCYPKLSGCSKFEKEIIDFCKQYYPNLIENDRTILNGKELDIYIPEIKLAIECDGLYWHSELQGVDKNYHLKKTKECEKKNIQLIHIFEDEWYNKQDIIKSILLAKMGKIKNKIYARKCIIKEVSSIEAKDFLFENHLQGSIAGASIGLYYNNELVSILTYGKPRFNKKYDIEILRFCNKKNTIVVGGLSKLSKYVKGYIISYSDSRYSLGTSYKNAGFDLVESSPPSYYYLKNFKRFSRINFQKHKLSEILENFDPTLTEWQNMQLNDYDRIWDCGNLVFEKTS